MLPCQEVWPENENYRNFAAAERTRTIICQEKE